MKIGFLYLLADNQEAAKEISDLYKRELSLDKILSIRAENQVEGIQYPYLEIKEM